MNTTVIVLIVIGIIAIIVSCIMTTDNDTMNEIVKNYNGILSLYKVDMSSAFNKKYATDNKQCK